MTRQVLYIDNIRHAGRLDNLTLCSSPPLSIHPAAPDVAAVSGLGTARFPNGRQKNPCHAHHCCCCFSPRVEPAQARQLTHPCCFGCSLWRCFPPAPRARCTVVFPLPLLTWFVLHHCFPTTPDNCKGWLLRHELGDHQRWLGAARAPPWRAVVFVVLKVLPRVLAPLGQPKRPVLPLARLVGVVARWGATRLMLSTILSLKPAVGQAEPCLEELSRV